MKKQVQLMGTIITLDIEADNAEEVLQETVRKLEGFERRFSANADTSQLAAIAKNAGKKAVRVDADVFELIAFGKKKSEEEGFLNVAIGPLIKLWNIGFENAVVPTKQAINQKLELIDPACIILNEEEQTVFLEKAGMRLDLGALAKGYFADQIIAYWKKVGVHYGYIDLGGNVLVCGPKSYTVGVQNPFLPRGQFIEVVKLENQSCVTSGIYERKLVDNGRTFHHLFDSKTGMPIKNDVASLTIIAKDSLICEYLTTQLFGYPAIAIIQKVKKMQGVEAIVVTIDKKMARSY